MTAANDKHEIFKEKVDIWRPKVHLSYLTNVLDWLKPIVDVKCRS